MARLETLRGPRARRSANSRWVGAATDPSRQSEARPSVQEDERSHRALCLTITSARSWQIPFTTAAPTGLGRHGAQHPRRGGRGGGSIAPVHPRRLTKAGTDCRKADRLIEVLRPQRVRKADHAVLGGRIGGQAGGGILPASEARLTMWPRSRSSIPGRTILRQVHHGQQVDHDARLELSARSCSQEASPNSTPALLTRMSSGPIDSAAHDATRCRSRGDLRGPPAPAGPRRPDCAARPPTPPRALRAGRSAPG